LHYIVVAWYRDAKGRVRGHVVDVGILPVDSTKWGPKKALLQAMRKLRDEVIEPGFPEATAAGQKPSGRLWVPGWFPIDSYYFGAAVRYFIRECHRMGIRRYIGSYGRGLSSSQDRVRYQHPTQETKTKPHIGEEYYVAWADKYALHYLIVNADYWKTVMREGFAPREEDPGLLTIFDAVTEDEIALVNQLAKQIVAERAYMTIVPERGEVLCYANDSNRANHFGDALYNAIMAGHLCGVRIDEPECALGTAIAAATQPKTVPEPLTTPDGRPFFITNRGE
jgi:hypothetical protein